MFIDHLDAVFCKVNLWMFCLIFAIELSEFFLLSCGSSLYILDMNPLINVLRIYPSSLWFASSCSSWCILMNIH